MVNSGPDYSLPQGESDPVDLPGFTDEFSIPTAEELESFRQMRIESSHMLRLAPDIYAWLLSHGPDWEQRADAILRREMMLGGGI